MTKKSIVEELLLSRESSSAEQRPASHEQSALLSKKDYAAAQLYFGFLLEEVSLAVSSGLDVLPAIDRVVESNNQILKDEKSGYGLKCANNILAKIMLLTKNGLNFQDAIRQVLNFDSYGSMSVALMHLAMAHKIGGDLVRPLQDISDSFQQQLQDEQDRQVQVMPIKATLPLLFLFAGMIVLSISLPILKVLDSTSGHTLKMEQ